MKGSFTYLILLLLSCPYVSSAQQIAPSIINVSGGSAINGYYRFDWSVGEMCLIDSYQQPNCILENGLLHSGTEKAKPPKKNKEIDFFTTGDIMIFPNPAFTHTELNLNLPEPGRVCLRLMNILGKLIEVRNFDYNGAGRIERIDFQHYPAGIYMLHVLLSPTDQSMPDRKGIYKLVHIIRLYTTIYTRIFRTMKLLFTTLLLCVTSITITRAQGPAVIN